MKRDLPVLCRPCARCGQAQPWPAEPTWATIVANAVVAGIRVRPLVRSLMYMRLRSMEFIQGLKYDGSIGERPRAWTCCRRALDRAAPETAHGSTAARADLGSACLGSAASSAGSTSRCVIARFVARTVRVPCEPYALARTRDTVSQVTLTRAERELNVRGAFGRARDPLASTGGASGWWTMSSRPEARPSRPRMPCSRWVPSPLMSGRSVVHCQRKCRTRALAHSRECREVRPG